jgi:hypothetical protein
MALTVALEEFEDPFAVPKQGDDDGTKTSQHTNTSTATDKLSVESSPSRSKCSSSKPAWKIWESLKARSPQTNQLAPHIIHIR